MTVSVPDPPQPANPTNLWLGLIVLLWAQLFYACIYGWRFGEYYSYGWYVPPLALLFSYRLRHRWKDARPRPLRPATGISALLALCALLTVLRTLGRVDPRWTLPLWIQAAVVIAVTFVLLHRIGGKDLTRRFVPVVAFACSAIPLPSVVESMMVANLTDSVIAASVSVLEWVGQPVRAMGDRISRMGEVVHVTEGCSGIKSAQSFLMAALFFGEWMGLRASARWWMIAAGIATAWTLNVTRASTLAWIRFENGEVAFEQAHDLAGIAAFVIGSGLLLGVAHLLDRDNPSARKTRRTVKWSAA
jgi:exosortase